jgi:hypothetical protein
MCDQGTVSPMPEGWAFGKIIFDHVITDQESSPALRIPLLSIKAM